MNRLSIAALSSLLFLAACSNGDEESTAPESGASTSAADSVEADEPTTTLEVFEPTEDEPLDTPFSLPPLDTDDIDVMLEEAMEDDQVTADEIAAILEAAGVESGVAACEADILAELGVEDISGSVELERAVAAMTPEMSERLATCLAAS